MSVFSVSALGAAYGGHTVLRDVSFAIERPGQLTALLGPNGSGKTTLLKAIAGLLPHTGQCTLQGQPLEALRPRALARRVSYIPQQSGINISLSARDVVLMGCNPRLGLLQAPTAAMQAATDKALQAVGLAELADRDYLTLSGGERQLCILARALAEDTDLLLLDEPDSALDLSNRTLLLRLLADHVRTGGRTALLCLHDPALALDVCDTLLLLKNGAVMAEVHPAVDPLPPMEEALAALYGPLQLAALTDRTGRRRLTLLPLPGGDTP